jgi:hypothetical protein
MALVGIVERRSGCCWNDVGAQCVAFSDVLSCVVLEERKRYCEGGVQRELRRPDALNGAPGESLWICRAEFMV